MYQDPETFANNAVTKAIGHRLADEAAIFEIGRSPGPDWVPLRWDQ